MNYQVTGNELLSLPTIRETDGAVEGITFLHMGAKGMLEIRGTRDMPLLKPMVNSKVLADLTWSREHFWIPSFTCKQDGLDISGTLLAPLGERAFIYRLKAHNTTCEMQQCQLQLCGCLHEVWHEINESRLLEGKIAAYECGWNNRFVMEMNLGLPLFAYAPIAAEDIESSFSLRENYVEYSFMKSCVLQPDNSVQADFIWGIGYDAVAASTSAKEIARHGFGWCYARTVAWLQKREKHIADAHLNELMNTNMFFSFFFASGQTLDTEEFCLMTSRSPRYYVSAAYWDRDSLLWSFPAILMADHEYAREILRYVFTRQIRNVGIHSRFIDGTILEPGFELDELCAPVIALKRYVDASGDRVFAEKPYIRGGVDSILRKLETYRHPQISLYETFLQPTDDVVVHPYLCYDNVLVWRMLKDAAALYGQAEYSDMADQVKEAILAHCTRFWNGKEMLIWSVDLNGLYDIYDEPPGSLMLLPHYGFCEMDDPLWLNAVESIRSPEYAYSFANSPIAEIGCPHAPHPWVLSICNSLLCGEKESAKQHLQLTNMDNGLACESIDEVTGECTTGAAFATCAGFLSYSLYQAFGGNENE